MSWWCLVPDKRRACSVRGKRQIGLHEQRIIWTEAKRSVVYELRSFFFALLLLYEMVSCEIVSKTIVALNLDSRKSKGPHMKTCMFPKLMKHVMSSVKIQRFTSNILAKALIFRVRINNRGDRGLNAHKQICSTFFGDKKRSTWQSCMFVTFALLLDWAIGIGNTSGALRHFFLDCSNNFRQKLV